jgi:transposase
LPAYSPDLNPIEQVLAKLRWLLQSAVERTSAGLWRRIGQVLDFFSRAECLNHLRHSDCRYELK